MFTNSIFSEGQVVWKRFGLLIAWFLVIPLAKARPSDPTEIETNNGRINLTMAKKKKETAWPSAAFLLGGLFALYDGIAEAINAQRFP